MQHLPHIYIQDCISLSVFLFLCSLNPSTFFLHSSVSLEFTWIHSHIHSFFPTFIVPVFPLFTLHCVPLNSEWPIRVHFSFIIPLIRGCCSPFRYRPYLLSFMAAAYQWFLSRHFRGLGQIYFRLIPVPEFDTTMSGQCDNTDSLKHLFVEKGILHKSESSFIFTYTEIKLACPFPLKG